MTTYLKRYYFDDRKLKQRALTELVSAFQSGRLVAFTGSMTTESYGYGNWNWLVKKYIEVAKELANKGFRDPQYSSVLGALDRVAHYADKGHLIDKRVVLSVVEEAIAAIDRTGSRGLSEKLKKKAAEIFGVPSGGTAGAQSTVEALIKELGIRRFATLNYDLELESAVMVESHQGGGAQASRNKVNRLIADGSIMTDQDVRHRMTRLLTSGLAVESDVRDRERPDRMIEFAVGSVDVDYRIMHLHGHACAPDTMIVGLRDYDRLYRKDDLAKLPFEHGQRILFGGNPVLFVGVGMSEPEVNSTLQDFVSNNPYRRFAPTFLLWNTVNLSTNDDDRGNEIAVRRIDFLQRLGIFALFDEDLSLDARFKADLKAARALANRIKAKDPTVTRAKRAGLRPRELTLLAGSVGALAATAKLVSIELRHQPSRWRSINARLEKVGKNELVGLWSTPPTEFRAQLAPRSGFGHSKSTFRVVVARTGAGKGSLAWRLAALEKLPAPFDGIPLGRRLIINAAYAFDTDFVLHAISRFLLKLDGDAQWESGTGISREHQFERSDAFSLQGGKALIVINGMERFFTVSGAPLSAELDHLLRRAAKAKGDVRWIFFGSDRIARYFETIAVPGTIVRFEDFCRPSGALKSKLALVRSNFLAGLLEAFIAESGTKSPAELLDPAPLALIEAHGSGEHRSLRRAVIGGLLNVATLERANLTASEAELAMEIVRAMAFIGAPVETVVLLHVPRVRRCLGTRAERKTGRLLSVLQKLKKLNVIVHINQFEDYPGDGQDLWERFGLHTSITSELRHQFGVPVSESKLSTSFNMSLYVAQPVDGFVPETAIHEELALLIDHLIGAYKDDLATGEEAPLSTIPSAAAVLENSAEKFVPPLDEAGKPAKLAAMCAPAATAALRAALAVVRGYYSTSSLLTLDRNDRRVSEDRDGVLLEHAERLQRLMRAYRKLDRFRSAIFAAIGDDAEAARILGPEAFYPDDLVWIYNELGVVYLAQGDLYSARTAFSEALRVNRDAVEFSDRSHNWRRITMNEVLLDIERAKLGMAERKLSEIEASINHRKLILPEGPACSRFDYIRREFGSKGPAERNCFHTEMMHEELLMAGLVLGHRGLCEHIRGHLRTSEALYEDSIAVLRRLGEHRAYAMIQHHYARLKMITEPDGGSEVQIRLAVTAAESVRQMDVAYHARISSAEADSRPATAHADVQRRALRHLTNALSYAAVMDLHRLRVEAWMSLARLKFRGGDYESALEHATEAMALAARYGLSLRKISLRLDIGQILIRRGDPKSGTALLERAAEAADRFGYQRAVEAAQRIRLEEGVLG